ncbi:tyrosine-type recombinase/integrase [Aquisediminimonas profunda]|uniref:tyrosine-type recombinase/integrase n=1 Tax=Aquisediminimonas profunda TaxID=1550733 RepID=UPI001C62A016|nr:site-specific integrase [Aquisediminimonas profunda]
MFNLDGQRKYLTQSETRRFLQEARRDDSAVHCFCWVIAVTGCRISEALALTPANIDFEERIIVFECLKKRRRHIYRSIPVPTGLLHALRIVLRTGRIQMTERIWPWSRMTGYRRVREVMERAHLAGTHASPKGLRHGFGVSAIQSGVPLNMVQRWLGHADMKTTAIYTSAMGPEERDIAARMWGRAFETNETGSSTAMRGRSPAPVRLSESNQKTVVKERVTLNFQGSRRTERLNSLAGVTAGSG